MIQFTDKDRQNIDVLIALAGLQRSRNNPISFNQDVDLLLSKGFTYGFSNASMFGLDKYGNTWQITTLQGSPSCNGGSWSQTVWYKVDERGLRHKREKGYTIDEFITEF